jgi:hypothetical protein
MVQGHGPTEQNEESTLKVFTKFLIIVLEFPSKAIRLLAFFLNITLTIANIAHLHPRATLRSPQVWGLKTRVMLAAAEAEA